MFQSTEGPPEMTPPRKITDDPVTVARRVRQEGLTATAKHYDVTPPAIRKLLAKHDLLERVVPDHSDVIPWRLAKEHGMAYEARMLRALGRREKGLEVPPRTASMLDRWLAELEQRNAVVTYDRTRGFGYDYRRDGDVGVVRRPQHATV